MITRLDANRHLKRFSSMTLVEQQAYLSEVQTWNERSATMLLRRKGEQPSRFMTATQCSVGWSDAECRAWEDGVRLMSAFAATDAMFQAAYTDSAKETIRWMVRELRTIQNSKFLDSLGDCSRGAKIQNEEAVSRNNDMTELRNNEEAAPEKRRRGRPRKQELPSIEGGVGGGSPVRPKHIDQYVHLLPKKTQERAALVKDLLQQIDVARENARLLTNDPKSLPDDRARWASLATKCDKEVRSIYKELDEEWEKLVKSGRVVVDDLGNARVIDADNEAARNTEMSESRNVEEEKAAKKDPNKRRLLRKWLVDTRRGNGDTRTEHVRKWEETFAEYLAIEGDAAFEDEKIKAAAKHYGIELNKPEVKS